MLAEFFQSAKRVQDLRVGPAGPLIKSFAHTLAQGGYAEMTARRHLRSAEHLAHWADRIGIAIDGPIERTLQRFDRHLRRGRRCPGRGCRPFGHTFRLPILYGARLFLSHLAEVGLVSSAADTRAVPRPPLFVSFCRWMQQQRGTCESTMANYGIHICELLARLGDEPATWDASGLRQFVMEGSRTCGWAAAKKRTTALRMFLRFLIAEGKCTSTLDGAIPVLAHWRLAALPRYLPTDDVERLIRSCDVSSLVGIRDRAILLLLARLGLRAGDVVQLRMLDLDWKDGWIHVCGKGHRQARLPLTNEVGQAVISYLDVRPQTADDAMFIRSRAPFRAFRSHCAVSVIVDRALTRAGVKRPSRGAAHLLRHSAATAMLRTGASLQDVAALLRHRSVTTTQIYAKVDVIALRKIAQPWPEVQPC
jgi:site-specific recombinase XerD